MLAYCITMASSAIIGICLWPFSIRHVFFGYRGQGSFEALKESEAYAIRFKLMWDQMAHAMLGKTKVVAGILLLLGLVLLLVVAIQKRRAHEKCSQTAGNLALLLIPGLFYVMIVSQIVPFFADRYVMCAFPFVVLIVIYVIYEGVRAVSARWTYGKYASAAALVLVSAVLIAGNHYGSNTPGYLFPVGQETVVLPENTDCVYVLADGEWNQSATDTSILAQCRQVGVVYEPYVDVLKEGYRCESGDSLLIYVQNGLDTEGVARHVQDTLGVAGLKEITRYYGGTACGILFSKE
jgi:hypothetical protein